jgi:hypothetical protein
VKLAPAHGEPAENIDPEIVEAPPWELLFGFVVEHRTPGSADEIAARTVAFSNYWDEVLMPELLGITRRIPDHLARELGFRVHRRVLPQRVFSAPEKLAQAPVSAA